MPASTTLTIRLSPDTKAKLGRLAEGTRRSRAFLAGEAVAAFVERELAIAEGIGRGLADVEAGRLVAHDEAMAELYAAVEGTAGRAGDEADSEVDDKEADGGAAGQPA